MKVDPEKFRLSALPAWFGTASAAYDAGQVTVGAVDASVPSASGRNRAVSFVQAAATLPETRAVSVVGNFPEPTDAQAAS